MAARFVLFDLGGVVTDWSPDRLYQKLIPDEAARRRFLSEVCTMAWHHAHDCGMSFADNAAALIGRFPQLEREIRAWGERWDEMFDGYVAGIERLIALLLGREVPLFALSNMPAEAWPGVRRMYPALAQFRHVVVSGEIGLAKPDPAIFKYTLARMGDPDPEDVLFVDDTAGHVDVASALGMRGHHFRGAAALERSLLMERLL